MYLYNPIYSDLYTFGIYVFTHAQLVCQQDYTKAIQLISTKPEGRMGFFGANLDKGTDQ